VIGLHVCNTLYCGDFNFGFFGVVFYRYANETRLNSTQIGRTAGWQDDATDQRNDRLKTPPPIKEINNNQPKNIIHFFSTRFCVYKNDRH
jgi:hypothetical protein